MARPASLLFTAGGTLLVPPGVVIMEFECIPAGGGGGGGATGGTTATNPSTGGGGGGAGLYSRIKRAVVPNETLTVVLGLGGGFGVAGANGVVGALTTVTGSSSGLIAQFAGASGGQAGFVSSANGWMSNGGFPTTVRGAIDSAPANNAASTFPFVSPLIPGQGGYSGVYGGQATQITAAVNGSDNPAAFGNFIGGLAGTQGTLTTNVGGCGGGGGAGGVNGSGGAAGNGGNGSAGAGGVGTAGSSAPANSGAGGGGGGAGGSGTSGGVGSSGGNGGSARLVMSWME